MKKAFNEKLYEEQERQALRAILAIHRRERQQLHQQMQQNFQPPTLQPGELQQIIQNFEKFC